jgi:hypothetical protein
MYDNCVVERVMGRGRATHTELVCESSSLDTPCIAVALILGNATIELVLVAS